MTSRTFLLFKAPAILWAIFIFSLLTMPGKSLPSVNLWNEDKLAHAAVFCIQALLLHRAFSKPAPLTLFKKFSPLLAAAIITLVYGALSEAYQTFLPDRVPDLLDVIANSAGVLLFVIVRIAATRTGHQAKL